SCGWSAGRAAENRATVAAEPLAARIVRAAIRAGGQGARPRRKETAGAAGRTRASPDDASAIPRPRRTPMVPYAPLPAPNWLRLAYAPPARRASPGSGDRDAAVGVDGERRVR